MLVAVVALYVVYIPFDSWTYLRFVLVPLALAPLGAAYVLRTLHGEPIHALDLPGDDGRAAGGGAAEPARSHGS